MVMGNIIKVSQAVKFSIKHNCGLYVAVCIYGNYRVMNPFLKIYGNLPVLLENYS